jgi:DNA invertase Pin-like site-specific DNA recombinase
MIRIAIYVRPGIDDIPVRDQINTLREIADERGWIVTGTFIDNGISGAKPRDRRPNRGKLLKDVTSGTIDIIAAIGIDRLAWSPSDLANLLGQLSQTKTGLFLLQQNLDSTTPTGRDAIKVMTQTLMSLKRTIKRTRIKTGFIKAAKQGRRPGRPKVPKETLSEIRQALRGGHGVRETARMTKTSPATVQRQKNQMGHGGWNSFTY